MTLQERILKWYAKHKRDLPWRNTTNPYHIVVSEVMLQQTQVERVIPYYHAWLKRFPTMTALAKATKKDVLRLWSGLGYNNRALRLQALAKQTRTIPKTEKDLLKLPGIGVYTARAILAFAFNKDVPVVDTNIRRVLIHELGLPEDISAEGLEAVAKAHLPKGKSREWHNALMDYGAVVLTARKTRIKPVSRQSTFIGSTRQVRGKVLKMLVQQGSVSLTRLRQEFAHPLFDDIIAKMEKEGLIQTSGGKARLAS